MRRRFTHPLALAAALLAAAACQKAAPPAAAPTDVQAARAAALPLDPADPAWQQAPAFPAALILQDLVEPRLLVASTPTLEVRALTDGANVAFRLAWPDDAEDGGGPTGRFADACAVQLPAVTGPDIPAPQMGEPGKSVLISYWSAATQARAEGKRDDIRAVFPNAAVDHYPFQAPSLAAGSPAQQAMEQRYAPAARLGNVVTGATGRAVQDLVADGPGTITTAPAQVSEGSGARSGSGWAVVLRRPLPEGTAAAGKTQVAFAVWQGGKGEVGSRKMRTAWVPLTLPAAPQAAAKEAAR